MRTIRRWAALAAAGTLVLAGCADERSAGTPDTRASEQSTPTAGAEDGSRESDSSATREESGGDSATTRDDAGATDPTGTHVARTASLTMTVEDVEQAGAKVRATAERVGGYVSSEETRIARDDAPSDRGRTTTPGRGPDTRDPSDAGSWGEIVLTVPVDELEAAMSTLSRVGEVTQRTSDAEDLSTQYTDTTSRVGTLKKSVSRLQRLIESAEDLEEIVELEGQLTEREADLEAMVSQQKSLTKRTATAPITVSLSSPDEVETVKEADETGFRAGLSTGWGGFTSALEAGLTVLGALTPFALTAALLLAPPAWWLRRRTTRAATVEREGE